MSKVTDKECRAFRPFMQHGKLQTRLKLGDGLFLEANTDTGRKRFIHRFAAPDGKAATRIIPGGSFPDELSLVEARIIHADDKRLLREGRDPRKPEVEAVSADVIPSFREWAEQHVEELAPPRERGKAQWLRQMTVTTGHFGALLIDEISAQDVKAFLAPYWFAAPTQAGVICHRISRVLKHRHSNIRPHVPFANPADYELIGAMMGRKVKHQVKHHASLDYEAVPDFIAQLRRNPRMIARLVEWCILTGVRIDREAGEARWGEIDWKTWTWTIPPERMKMQDDVKGEPHVVPISPGMARLLRQVRPSRKPDPKAFIFPSERTGRTYSHQAVYVIVKTLNPAITTHGFRATLVNWGTAIPHAGQPPYERELMEVCLAHSLGNNVTAAYLRDRWLERRRAVMRQWSKWCYSTPAANVVPFRRRAA